MRSRCGGRCCWRSKRPSARPIRTRQRRLLTFVIVGGGPTGVELAGALAEIARQSLRQDFRSIRPESARIVLLEGSPHLLARVSRPAARRRRARSLERLGVEVRTGVGRHRRRRRRRRRGARLPARTSRRLDVERIAAQTVLWAAGVAASPLAKSLGVPLDRAGRVSRRADAAVPGHPEIFVVGDVCALQQDGKPLPGVAQVAMQEGAHAARNILRAIEGEPLEPFRYRDYGNMATIGRGSAVADIGPAEDVRISSPGSSGSSCTSSG